MIETRWDGQAADIGIVADDLDAAMAMLRLVGVRWSTVLTWDTTMRLANGELIIRPVRFVTTLGDEPHLKVIEGEPGSYFAPVGGMQLHHVSYWVDDLESAKTELLMSGEYAIDAEGLDSDGSVRFSYLQTTGLRIELGLTVNREAFRNWASGGDHA